MINYIPLKYRIFTAINSALSNVIDTSKAIQSRMEQIGFENMLKLSEDLKGAPILSLHPPFPSQSESYRPF